ncbi:MAG: hypothetical protein M1825_002160 [Sarcosagium campestre]|nr:MAG: hypothetical protein M1825_002160 [Sarcosagium campestre]
MKRSLPEKLRDSQAPAPKFPASLSAAAKFNVSVLRKLERALEANPEIDLTTVFPNHYAVRLAGRKSDKDMEEVTITRTSPPPESDESSAIQLPKGPATIVHPLSDTLKIILGKHGDGADINQASGLIKALVQTLRQSDIIWQSKSSSNHYVAKCSSDVVVKPIDSRSDFTEYTSMQFLALHKPQLPVPRPHGLIVADKTAFLFMSFVPGVSLGKMWPELQEPQKLSISNELDRLFYELRQLSCPAGMPLGGVAGEGCKDTRRHTKISTVPCYSSSDFWKFQHSEARSGSQVYLEFLRRLTSPIQAQHCVFTHGDIRTENIIVQLSDDGNYRISGLIDWEMSGFYPEDFECTKLTNTLAINETEDWYLYLPQCISPARYTSRWLADRLWDRNLV